jgi:hypothetical protein
VLKDRGVLALPNSSKEEQLLLSQMAARQGMTWETLTGGIDWGVEGCDSEVDTDAGADMEEV